MFKIQLANFFIPGPMQYAPNSGYIIIANSKLEIEAYSYSSMKIFTNNDIEKQKNLQIEDNGKSKLAPAWISNIGE